MSASVTVRAEWDMGHRLPHHNGACHNLHGHHYIAEVTVRGEINHEPNASSEGMVVDFTDIKTQLKGLAATLDHKFLLHAQDALVSMMQSAPGVVLVDYVPTAENIALWLLEALPTSSRVKVWETPTSCAEVTRW